MLSNCHRRNATNYGLFSSFLIDFIHRHPFSVSGWPSVTQSLTDEAKNPEHLQRRMTKTVSPSLFLLFQFWFNRTQRTLIVRRAGLSRMKMTQSKISKTIFSGCYAFLGFCRLRMSASFPFPARMWISSNVGEIQIRCAGPQVIDCKTSLEVFDIHWNILLHTAVLCYSDRSLELEQDTMVAILGLGQASEKLGQWKMAKWKPVQSPWLSRCGKFLHNWQIKAFELRGLLKVFPKLPRLAGFEQTFNELAFLSEKAVK